MLPPSKFGGFESYRQFSGCLKMMYMPPKNVLLDAEGAIMNLYVIADFMEGAPIDDDQCDMDSSSEMTSHELLLYVLYFEYYSPKQFFK